MHRGCRQTFSRKFSFLRVHFSSQRSRHLSMLRGMLKVSVCCKRRLHTIRSLVAKTPRETRFSFVTFRRSFGSISPLVCALRISCLIVSTVQETRSKTTTIAETFVTKGTKGRCKKSLQHLASLCSPSWTTVFDQNHLGAKLRKIKQQLILCKTFQNKPACHIVRLKRTTKV